MRNQQSNEPGSSKKSSKSRTDSLKYSKRQNALTMLTQKFIELANENLDRKIDLNWAMEELRTPKRRLYDITNVLQGVNYVKKVGKNKVKWIGPINQYKVKQEIRQLKNKLFELRQRSHQIFGYQNKIIKQLVEEYAYNDQVAEKLYPTIDDLNQLKKLMLGRLQTKSFIYVKMHRKYRQKLFQNTDDHAIYTIESKMRSQHLNPYVTSYRIKRMVNHAEEQCKQAKDPQP